MLVRALHIGFLYPSLCLSISSSLCNGVSASWLAGCVMVGGRGICRIWVYCISSYSCSVLLRLVCRGSHACNFLESRAVEIITHTLICCCWYLHARSLSFYFYFFSSKHTKHLTRRFPDKAPSLRAYVRKVACSEDLDVRLYQAQHSKGP